MSVLIFHTIKSDLAISHLGGAKLFETISSISPDKLVLSFEGIKRISSAFLNESIGKYALQHPTDIDKVQFIYPEAENNFEYRVKDVIENALMGDEYDTLVDNAYSSL